MNPSVLQKFDIPSDPCKLGVDLQIVALCRGEIIISAIKGEHVANGAFHSVTRLSVDGNGRPSFVRHRSDFPPLC